MASRMCKFPENQDLGVAATALAIPQSDTGLPSTGHRNARLSAHAIHHLAMCLPVELPDPPTLDGWIALELGHNNVSAFTIGISPQVLNELCGSGSGNTEA